MFDESGTFFGSMGRYGGNGDKTYDKSYWLSLWSAPRRLTRDLKQGRVQLINPLMQLSINTHPWVVATTLTGNKNFTKTNRICMWFLI